MKLSNFKMSSNLKYSKNLNESSNGGSCIVLSPIGGFSHLSNCDDKIFKYAICETLGSLCKKKVFQIKGLLFF